MKILLSVFLICSFSCHSKIQTSNYWPEDKQEVTASGVSVPKILTHQQERNFEILCRVWGFVKYFHPKVAKGEVNVDKALFMIMPEVLNIKDDKALQKRLYSWVKELGDIAENTYSESVPSNVFIEPKFTWLEKDSLLDGRLRILLNEIYHKRHRGNGYYVRQITAVGNPDFSNEFPYKNIRGEDDGMRMLALFRYWNTIEYFFPSKYITADNWDNVLSKFIPLFAQCENDVTYRMMCYQLVATIHDTHAANISYDKTIQHVLGDYKIPAIPVLVDGKVTLYFFETDEAKANSKLREGDQFVSINGVEVKKIIDSLKPYIAASNNTSLLDIAMSRIFRSSKSENKLSIIRNDKTIDVIENYVSIKVQASGTTGYMAYPMYKKIGEDIGYINLGKIRINLLENIFKELEKTKGIVIDIRTYCASFVPFELGKYIKPEPSQFAKFTMIDTDLPGRFVWREGFPNGEVNPNFYKGKIVILVHGWTQSQSEYTTMALRSAPNAIVIGSQTSGADGNVSDVFLPGGMSSYMSGIGVYYPDGKPTQGIGIVPDIIVRPTLSGIKQGKDELLEKAVNYIRENN